MTAILLIILHHAPLKATSVLVLFVIFGGYFSLLINR